MVVTKGQQNHVGEKLKVIPIMVGTIDCELGVPLVIELPVVIRLMGLLFPLVAR